MVQYSFSQPDHRSVAIELEPGCAINTEPGAFIESDAFIEPATGLGGIFKSIKRAIAGEKLIRVRWHNNGDVAGTVRVAPSYGYTTGAVSLQDESFHLQKGAWLASEENVEIAPKFSVGLGGLFGGEGVVFQKVKGTGTVFFAAGGDIITRQLAPGQTIKVDTGCIVGYGEGVQYGVRSSGGPLSMFFGREGIVLATLTGPGLVFLQTHPSSEIRASIRDAAEQAEVSDE